MQKIKITIYSLVFGLAILFAGQVQAATEFISIIDPDSGSGYDFDSLSSWATISPVDLTAATTLVFSHGGITGTIPDGADMIGGNSGATASTTRVTASQILLYNIQGTFESGEQIQVQGATGNYVVSSDTGDSAIAVAECRSTGGTADIAAVVISGWTTSATNYIKIWTDPTDHYGRHNGKADNTKYRIDTSGTNSGISIENDVDYVTIDGLQITDWYGSYRYGIVIKSDNNVIKNNILHGNQDSYDGSGIVIDYAEYTRNNYIYNNILYDLDSSASAGIRVGGSDDRAYVFNNTVVGSETGIAIYGDSVAYNNISVSNSGGDYYYNGSSYTADYNISSDATANGSNSITNSIPRFYDQSNYDYHLSSSDTVALNAGTSSVFWDVNAPIQYDIDGTARGGAIDIGADEIPVEFVSTICENASAGGDCADINYTNINDWENEVYLDITATTSRIFSGSITGTLSLGDWLDVYDCTGSCTDTGINVRVNSTSSDQIVFYDVVGTSSPLIVTNGTQFRLSGGTANMWTVTGTGDDLGASMIMVAKIDGVWNNDDVDEVNFTSAYWGTDNDNYVKVYTTDLARHKSKWTDTAYRLVSENANVAMLVTVNNIWIDGLQFMASTTTTGNDTMLLRISSAGDENEIRISNNIFKGLENFNNSTHWHEGITMYQSGGTGKAYIWNNIVYNFGGGSGASVYTEAVDIDDSGYTFYFYNNTVVGSENCVYNNRGTHYFYNNIVQNCTNGFTFTADGNSSYNITDLDDSDAAFGPTVETGTVDGVGGDTFVLRDSGQNFLTTVKPGMIARQSSYYAYVVSVDSDTQLTMSADEFDDGDTFYIYTNLYMDVEFLDEANDDYRLKDNGTLTKNYGHDLRADTGVISWPELTTDLEGALRDSDDLGWDIGADELPAKQYRSVGNDSSSLGSSGTVTISGRTATFSTAQANNVGVGDVIQFGSSGYYDLAFITARSSSTEYSVQAWDTKAPTATTSASFNIYRAHLLLDDWEDQVEGDVNDTIDDTVSDKVLVNQNLLASNTAMMVAAYASTNGDTEIVSINGWATGKQNYIRVYTPSDSSEVGVSQRHTGKWDSTKYNINYIADDNYRNVIISYNGWVRIDGLQISGEWENRTGGYGLVFGPEDDTTVYISNNIVRAIIKGSSSQQEGIRMGYYATAGTRKAVAWNNIIYGWTTTASIYGQHSGWGNCYWYNNILYGNNDGFKGSSQSKMILVNNISYNNTDNYSGGGYSSLSSNNISGPIQTDAPGNDSLNGVELNFIDEDNMDFHLIPGSPGVDVGTSSLMSSWSSVGAIGSRESPQYDIDGNFRRTWDIGADEASHNFVSTVMETGGDFSSLASWEAANQVDLVASTTAVFSCVTATGTWPYNSSVIGTTSLAVASSTVFSTSSSQILLSNITGTFQVGEKVILEGGSGGDNYCILADAGNPANAVAKIDGAWTSIETGAIVFSGWETGRYNYIKVYTTDSARHNGKWNDNKYSVSNTEAGFAIYQNHLIIDGLQFELSGTSEWRSGIYYNTTDYGYTENISISNNIFKESGSGNNRFGISNAWQPNISDIKIYNNIFYDITYGIFMSHSSDSPSYIFNNTIYNASTGGVYINTSGQLSTILKNNIVNGAGTNYGGWLSVLSSNNISNDSTAPGTNSLTTTTVQFLDATNNDFHLHPNDTAARDAGTSSPLLRRVAGGRGVLYDIDGTARGASFDIGADEVPVEFVSTICESSSSGGDCAEMDYSTLNNWENAVEIDLTASTTRVYSGSITGTLGENNQWTLIYPNFATTTITGYVVATTSDQIIVDGISGTTTPLSVVTGSILRVSSSNYWTISGAGDALGASPIAIAKIDGSWNASDTTMVIIEDWQTDIDNYIKIYTTGAARHDGKWDYGKYRLVVAANNNISGLTNNYRVDGLQLFNNQTGTTWPGMIGYSSNSISGEMYVSNNIFWADFSGLVEAYGNAIRYPSSQAYGTAYIYNNLFYNIYDGNSSALYLRQYTNYVYNNTFYNCYHGINQSSYGTVIAKNNLFASTSNPYWGDFEIGTDYNATDGTDSPGEGSNNLTNQSFSFVGIDNMDFHLALTDTGARNIGVNLINDSYLKISDDIDGSARANGFDIGADEAPEPTYRSVGPSNTTALSTGSSTTMTIDGVTATFSSAQPDNVGVGDAIQYDSDGNSTIDSLAFIFERISSTEYRVVTASGTVPTAVAGDQDWQIYRAYTSLYYAERGYENTGINGSVRDFDTWTDGKDLVASNEIWYIACYADAIDSTTVSIDDWTTGANNYIKVFTPVTSSEVGVTQRHSGKWGDGYMRSRRIQIAENYIKIDGIAIKDNVTEQQYFIAGSTGSGEIYISNCYSHYVGTGNARLYEIWNVGSLSVYMWNNIGIHESTNSDSPVFFLNDPDATGYFYNNTGIVNSGSAFINSQGISYWVNNLGYVYGSGSTFYSYSGTINASYCASNDDRADNWGGNDNIIDQTFKFLDIANHDYHLAPDSPGIDVGTSSVSTIVTDDTDGQTRRQWDIGADEASQDFVSTVMESGGTFTSLSGWETANQVDLTATTTAVFNISTSSGYIPFNSSVTGATSGAIASTTVVSTSSMQVLLYNIKGTFQSGEDVELDGATSNNVTLSNLGNPANAVAKIDGAWSSADNFTDIDGFTTGRYNTIKVYTTKTARHQGKWDDNKYRLIGTDRFIQDTPFRINDDYVTVDGIQGDAAYNGSNSADYQYGIDINNTGAVVKNNIIRKLHKNYGTGIGYGSAPDNGEIKIYNNIIYDFYYGISAELRWETTKHTASVFNNTVINSTIRIRYNTDNGNNVFVYNNLVQGSLRNYFYDNINSSNNISEDDTSPDSAYQNKAVSFEDEQNNDYHLALTDTAARNAGVDLSSDATSSFVMDIDGTSRGGAWDIGADEAATEFVSSIMQTGGDYASLASWESNVETDLVASGTLVYSGSLTGNLAGNDQVTLYRSGTSQNISGYVVATSSSQILIDGIIRGLTSLGEVEPLYGQTGDQWRVDALNYWTVSGSGDALGAPVIAVAKIDGAWSATDTNAVTIDGWETGPGNYIKVYTTDTARHPGKWSYEDYRLEFSGNILTINEDYFDIDGFQFLETNTIGNTRIIDYDGQGILVVKNSIFKALDNVTATPYGIVTEGPTYAYNLIIYNLNRGIDSGDYNTYIYNSTFYDMSNWGIRAYNNKTIAKNNITANCGSDCFSMFSGNWAANSDYNLSDDATAPGSNSKINTTVTFISTSTEDFHISPSDTGAKNAGVNLSRDSSLAPLTQNDIVYDIDGDSRSLTQPWDIGADEIGDVSSGVSARTSGNTDDMDTLTNGLVGHWTFNEGLGSTVVDRSGNGNDGTWAGTGTHWTAEGRFGNAGNFNGSNDYVEIDTNLNHGNLVTVSFWVYEQDTRTGRIMISKGDYEDDGWYLTNSSAGDWSMRVNSSGAGETLHSDGYDIPLNQWTHLTVVIDNVNLTVDFYENGRLITRDTYTTAFADNTARNLRIGDYSSEVGTYSHNAKYDEIRIYNRLLSQREIALLHNEGKASVEWHFKNNYKDTGSLCELNTNQCKNLTAGGTGNQFGVGYLQEGITSLNTNSNGYAVLSDDDYFNISSTSDFSIVATLKTSETANRAIFSDTACPTGVCQGFGLALDYGYGDGVPFLTIGDTDNNGYTVTASTSISDGVWHTVIATFDEDNASNCKIYIDGVDRTGSRIGTLSNIGDLNNITKQVIGAWDPLSSFIEAEIDRVAFYTYALTRADVLRENSGGFAAKVGDDPSKTTHGQAHDPFGGVAPVAWWKLDEMSGNIAYDYASSSLNGTWYGSGTSTWHTNGKVGMGGEFNGADDYIVINDNDILDGQNAMTLDFWIKLDTDTGNRGVVSKYVASDGARSYDVWVSSGEDLSLRVSSDGINNEVQEADTNLSVNNWEKITMVFDNGVFDVYKNNVLISDDGDFSTHTSIYSGSADFKIGIQTSNILSGYIDDVKIYNYARTPAQIAWDYNKGKPIAHWKLDDSNSGDADGATLLDSSGNGNSGTGDDGANNTGLDYVTGKFGEALQFDGVDDNVQLSSIPDLTGSDQITISAWINPSNTNQLENVVEIGQGGGHALWKNASGGFYAGTVFGTSGWTTVTSDNFVLSSGSWIHVVYTYDNSSQKLYKNGRLIKTSSISEEFSTPTGNMYISTPGSNEFTGFIDDVRVYNYALDTWQIQELYNGGGSVKFGR